MKLIARDDTRWRPVPVSTSVKIDVLTLADSMYRNSRRGRYFRRNEETVSKLLILWETGLFNLSSLERATGITRKSIRTWLTGRVDFSRVQVRGRINPEHFKYLIERLTLELQVGDEGREKFIAQLIDEGSTPYLVRAIFDEESKRDNQPVRTPVRPDDEGHPEERQGVSEPEHQDQVADGPGEGEEEPEPADAGPVQGAAPRDHPAEPRPVEDEGGESEYARVVAAQGRINERTSPEADGAEWDPFENYEPDLEGDSFLLDHEDEGPGGLVPGFPDLGEDFELLSPPES